MITLKLALVFGIMFGLDWAWARYTAAVASKRAVAAGSWAVGTVIGGGMLTLSYLDLGAVALLPACVASFTATWLAVRPKAEPQRPCPHGYADWDDCPECCH